MSLRLVVTGTRHGRPDVRDLLLRWAAKYGVPQLLIVGDAAGVDAQALEFAKASHDWDYLRVRVRPTMPSPQRYHDRNQRMVDFARPGDHCLALPDDKSRGTFDCANRAKAAGLIVHIVR